MFLLLVTTAYLNRLIALGLPSDRVSVPTFGTDPNRLTRLGKSETSNSSIIALVALIELGMFKRDRNGKPK